MPRNLDVTALRSFVAVADAGGVTRAAGFLNLTQSAVSMQLKRLEEMLDARLFDRSQRTIALTTTGERLLSDARRIVDLNDRVVARMTDPEFEGELVLGVPHDIVYPAVPEVLRQFHREYPRMRVQLISSNTRDLKEKFARGEVQLILTTEEAVTDGGETLTERAMIWAGARGGTVWKERPVPLGFCSRCLFRPVAQAALDQAGIPWETVVDSDRDQTVDAMISADLAINAVLEGTLSPYVEAIPHGGALPEIGSMKINLYGAVAGRTAALDTLTEMVRHAYRSSGRDHNFSGRAAAA